MIGRVKILRVFSLTFALLLLSGTQVGAQTLNPDDVKSLLNDTVWYKQEAGTSSGCVQTPTSIPGPTGSISPLVGKGMTVSAQQQFQQILVSAGSKFNVDPNFIASFYYAENARTGDSTNNADSATPPPVTGDGNWREPAPPYGQGQPWIRNSFTASGPFQFIDSTWASYGVDGNGDGVVDVNDLTDATFAAGKYLAALGATTGATQDQLKKAAFGYNRSDTYVQSVINTYNYLSSGGQTSVTGSNGSCSTSTTPGGCGSSGSYSALVGDGSNFAGIDQGIDFTPANSSGYNICAPASGTITLADQTGHIFDRTSGQAEIIEKLDQLPNAPNSSQYIYYAEIIQIDNGIRVGTHVNKGDLIGTNNLSPGIEVGWGSDPTHGFLCTLGQTLGSQTPCGQSFNSWIKDISAGKVP